MFMFRFISNVIILYFAWIGGKKVYNDHIAPFFEEEEGADYNG